MKWRSLDPFPVPRWETAEKTDRSVLYSLTKTEIETEIYVISLSEMKTEMLCKTETKYKRKSESIKRNTN